MFSATEIFITVFLTMNELYIEDTSLLYANEKYHTSHFSRLMQPFLLSFCRPHRIATVGQDFKAILEITRFVITVVILSIILIANTADLNF